ncbi:hypothetical protein KY084_13485 [Stakelama sp. CBK3Z-3]|uniref:Uncharacterized protein n=1 Tax=Stakelama flava TaxID=2860338 RepID=A0ABS6XNT0_9SPHN|nr:hypothetical protein [Stakelama flava]MBW4331880.1 hypothetical protein [Stakelama flava]
MIDHPHRQYWQKREREERESADRAVDASARRAHREMAERYCVMARDDADMASSTIPRRG